MVTILDVVWYRRSTFILAFLNQTSHNLQEHTFRDTLTLVNKDTHYSGSVLVTQSDCL